MIVFTELYYVFYRLIIVTCDDYQKLGAGTCSSLPSQQLCGKNIAVPYSKSGEAAT